ncbi:MAG: UDP-N-acetylmuramate--L-alanine ligase [Candidatus Neomarinimicrobiota bacterium]
MTFRKINHIFFVGIGGIGMSGIAELLLNLGFKISGSDINENENVKRLQNLNQNIKIGHDPINISSDIDLLVYSSAVSIENPEIIRARQKNIPIIRRAEMLGELISLKETSIAVGGTHGKTTTSSMIGTILSWAKKDPTLVVGGLVHNLDTNSKLGSGNIIVVEADEFDRSFLALKPTIAVVTNIELEHTDCYKNLDDLQNAFIQFCKSVPFYGEIIVCIDSPVVQNIIKKIERPIITYGRSRDAAYRAKNLRFQENKSTYSVFRAEECLGDIEINAPGEHNILNSLAAVILGLEMGLSFKTIKSGIKSYNGVRRRFDIKGNYNNILVIDDYAHHPTEVEATLKSAKSGWDRRIVAVFQPHLFTRTRDFFKEFANALNLADMIFITDIYPAREEPIPGITSNLIYDEISNKYSKDCQLIQDLDDLKENLDRVIQPGDMLITMGAGNIWRYNNLYVKHLQSLNNGINQ